MLPVPVIPSCEQWECPLNVFPKHSAGSASPNSIRKATIRLHTTAKQEYCTLQPVCVRSKTWSPILGEKFANPAACIVFGARDNTGRYGLISVQGMSLRQTRLCSQRVDGCIICYRTCIFPYA